MNFSSKSDNINRKGNEKAFEIFHFNYWRHQREGVEIIFGEDFLAFPQYFLFLVVMNDNGNYKSWQKSDDIFPSRLF